MSQHTSSDPVIIEALRSGVITADPETGRVYRNGRMVAAGVTRAGYRITRVAKRNCLQHRIVWIAANGPIPDGLEINHRNGLRDDNRLANLELVTRSQNVRHARANAALRDYPTEALDPEFLDRLTVAASSAHTTRKQWAEFKDELARIA